MNEPEVRAESSPAAEGQKDISVETFLLGESRTGMTSYEA